MPKVHTHPLGSLRSHLSSTSLMASPPHPPPDVAAHHGVRRPSQDAVTPKVEIHESKPELLDDTGEVDIAGSEEKQSSYEALYARRLKAKYFSKKAFDGADVYEVETTIENEIVKSSRWPCMRSFADPVEHIEDQNGSESSAAEISTTPSKKHSSKKSC